MHEREIIHEVIDASQKSEESFLVSKEEAATHRSILADQYEYFKKHGKPKHSFLNEVPVDIRYTKEGGRKFIPKKEGYQFEKESIEKKDEEARFEQEIHERLQEIHTFLQEITRRLIPRCTQIFPESRQFFEFCAAVAGAQLPSYDLSSSQTLEFYKVNVQVLKGFFDSVSGVAEKIEKHREEVKQYLTATIHEALLFKIGIPQEEIKAIAEKQVDEYFRLRAEKYSLDADMSAPFSQKLGDCVGVLNELIAGVDTSHPDFLSREEATPVFFSLWLTILRDGLKELDMQTMASLIRAYEVHFTKTEDDSATLMSRIFADVNELTQIKEVAVHSTEIGNKVPQEPKPGELLPLEVIERREKDRIRFQNYLTNLEKTDPNEARRLKTSREPPFMMREKKREFERDARRREATPRSQLGEKESPLSTFREFDSETWRNRTVGYIETQNSSLGRGALFITSRVGLGKNGYAPYANEKESITPPLIDENEKMSLTKSIVHFPCTRGYSIELPVPASFRVESIGWSPYRHVKEGLLQPVDVARHTGEDVLTCTNVHGDGWLHYVLVEQTESANKKVTGENTREVFTTDVDSSFVQSIVADAKSLKTTEEKVFYISEQLTKKGFIYAWGSDVLDIIYHETGKDRFYQFVENIGIGDCQLYSAMVAQIFRRAGIPARIAQGKITKDYAFEVIGHAKVEYQNDDGAWQEFEATSISSEAIFKLKDADSIDRAVVEECVKDALKTHDKEEFAFFARNIRELVVEERPSFEIKKLKLEEFSKKFFDMLAQQPFSFEKFEEMFDLACAYESYAMSISDVQWLQKHGDPNYEEYRRVSNIKPLNWCEEQFENALQTHFFEGDMTIVDCVPTIEQVLDKEYNFFLRNRNRAPREALLTCSYQLQSLLDCIRKNKKDIAPLLASPHIRAVLESRDLLFNELALDQSFEEFSAVLREWIEKGYEASSALTIIGNFCGHIVAGLNGTILWNEHDVQKYRALVDCFRTNSWIKELVRDVSRFPAECTYTWFSDFEEMFKRSDLFSQEEKAGIALAVIQKYIGQGNGLYQLPSALSFFDAWGSIAITEGTPQRAETVLRIQERIEQEIRELLAHPDSLPFLPSYVDENAAPTMTARNAEQFFVGEMKAQDEQFSQGQTRFGKLFHTYEEFKFLFPELSLSPALIGEWNARYERTREKQLLDDELRYTISMDHRSVEVNIERAFHSGGAFEQIDLIHAARLFTNSLRSRIFPLSVDECIHTLEEWHHPSSSDYQTQREREMAFVQVVSENVTLQQTMYDEFASFAQKFFQAALGYFMDNATKRDQNEMRTLAFAREQGQKEMEEKIPEHIKKIYDAFPLNVMQEYFAPKKIENVPDYDSLGLDAHIRDEQAFDMLYSFVEVSLQSHEVPSFFHTFYERRFKKAVKPHPFFYLHRVNADLCALLEQTAHNTSGFPRRLKVIKKSFKNSLNPEGEFVNLNHEFVKKGHEFAGFRHYQKGDDIRTVDWNASARSETPIVKTTYHEEEPKNHIAVVNIDSLFMRTPERFEDYANWGKICNELYERLMALMLDISDKKRTFDVVVFFHGEKIYEHTLPIIKMSAYQNVHAVRFEYMRQILVGVFAEINKMLPVLEKEYTIAHTENFYVPFIDTRMPRITLTGPTNIITLSHKANPLGVAAAQGAAASRMV